jgi:hypothetical protein
MMLTIACVLKSGGIYNTEWVARLKSGVEKNIWTKHKFVCLSDVDVPCSRLPLEHDWPGWWSKIELFRLPPPVLFFDLDTLIIGNINELTNFEGFVMLRDFYQSKRMQSAVMAWNTGSGAAAIYDKFAKEPQHYIGKYKGGDQDFISEVMPDAHCWQDMIPGQIVSYKVHIRKSQRNGEFGDGNIPNNARVICLHGQPKFDAIPELKPLWEAA